MMVGQIAGSSQKTESAQRLVSWRVFFGTFLRFFGPYWTSEDKWSARLLLALLAILTIGTVAVPIAINLWSERFFDALETRSMDKMAMLIGLLFAIIAGNAVVSTAHLWVKRRLQVGWRGWATRRMLGEWMERGRHYQVTYMPGEHTNPDGRIAEDARIATEYAIELGHSLLYCIALLASFVDILWNLSGSGFVIDGVPLRIPGDLVWIALLYSATGISIALFIGQPLIRATERRQTFEANFRFGLVHARENSLTIALIHGETDERRRLGGLFGGVIEAWRRQTMALFNITLYSAIWSVLFQLFPLVIVAPRYIMGAITLGVLMRTVQAFQQTVAALSWPIDHLSMLADWRASVQRVLGLHDALASLIARVSSGDGPLISAVPGDDTSLTFDDVALADPEGHIELAPFSARIVPGERVLIAGDSGAAAKLFKAVAGLWPWGHGRILLPKGAAIFFVPQRSYMPIGPLLNNVCYPASPGDCGEQPILHALSRVGLEHLIPRVNEIETWEENLTAAEQQRLGFARILLHRPNWIFIQEATDALEPAEEAALMRILIHDLPQATLITIGHHPQAEDLHTRKIMLVRHSAVVHVEEAELARAAV